MIDDTRNQVRPNAASSGGTVKAGGAARQLSRLATIALIWLAAPHDASAEPFVVSVVTVDSRPIFVGLTPFSE